MEQNPSATFYAWELRQQSPDGLEPALEAKLLRRLPVRGEGARVRLATGQTVLVTTQGGELWGLDDVRRANDPVPLSPGDLVQYQLSFESLTERLQEANELTGQYCKLDDRLHYLGRLDDEVGAVAIVLGLFREESSALRLALSVPTYLSETYSSCIICCPSFKFESQDNLVRLEAKQIRLGGFADQPDWIISWPQIRLSRSPSPRALLVIEQGGLKARYGVCDLRFTPQERDVLCRLAASPGKAISSSELAQGAGLEDAFPYSGLKKTMSQLRKKLSAAATDARNRELHPPPNPIRTDRGKYQAGAFYTLTLRQFQVSAPPDPIAGRCGCVPL